MICSISNSNPNAKWEVNNNIAPGFLANVFNAVCKGEMEIININSVQDVHPSSEWQTISSNPSESNALGISDNHGIYHYLTKNQSLVTEIKKTIIFIKKILNDIGMPECRVEFINYGDTELVYAIKRNDIAQWTLLISQPWLEKGTIKKEYDNLLKLKSICPKLIVSPTQYFELDTREAYLTPFYKQARCIASNGSYGVYIPEPYYRFESFNNDDIYLITKIMIANLVRLYDDKDKLALAACKLGGGDFILEKKYDEVPHTEKTTIENMHLTAARELISIDLKDYLKLLRNELVKTTYYQSEKSRNKSILVNHKNRVPMSKEAIQDGIALGLKLRKQ